MKKLLLAGFLLISILEIYSIVTANTLLHHIAKPLLMLVLGAYYIASSTKDARSWFVVMALFFSFLGDSFLLYEEKQPLYFMLGLGCFLVAHVMYIYAFRQHKLHAEIDQLHRIQVARFSFPVVLAGTGLIVVLYSRLGDLRLPVIVYALILMIMVLQALFRYGHTSQRSFLLSFGGAVLFMISDSILAINKFLQSVPSASLYIMVSYIAAQFFIVKGLLEHDLTDDQYS